jgi:hypothetical protein
MILGHLTVEFLFMCLSFCGVKTSPILHLDHRLRSPRSRLSFITKVLASSLGYIEDFVGFSHAKCWTVP